MKSKTKPFYAPLLKVLFLSITPLYLQAQVTIGTLSVPQSGALLDLKEWDIASNSPDSANSEKGILFPKVNLLANNSLSPLYATTAEPQINTSKGMIVYNVNSKATGLSVGLCIWNGKEWNSIVGGGPSNIAKVDIDCAGKIIVNGNLAKNEMLVPTVNTINLPVSVQQEGKYHILAYSEPDNQYYFEASGEFLKKGNFNLILNGIGPPKYATSERNNTKDKIKIYMNGKEYDVATKCPSMVLPELNVDDVPANYYFNCNQVNISGAKLKMSQSSAGSFITIRLQVSKASIGGKYHIQTNTSNGIMFEGKGTLQAEQQTITLDANGAIPSGAGMSNFYFITNSSDPRLSSCSVEIPIIGRNINVFVWGINDNSIWDIGGNAKGVNNLLKCAEIFGLGSNGNPIYPVEGITFTRSRTFPSLNNVDVVIISYNASELAQNSYAKTLIDFVVNDKGVLIQCLEGGNPLTIPEGIFGNNVITRNNETISSNCAATLISGNQIVNGEYMDLSNKKIGYDGGYNLSFKINDLTNIETIATRDSDKAASVIKHKSKPYILLGDAGIFSGANTPSAHADLEPLLVNNKGLPEIKTNHHPNSSTVVYNAHFFANIMLWAIKYRFSVKP